MSSAYKIMLIVVLLAAISPAIVSAHPGRTASDGCHYCRTNCAKWGVATGERHCHGSSVPAKKEDASPTSNLASKRSAEDIISEKIISSMAEYRGNHNGYRERLIEVLLGEWGGVNSSQMRGKVADLVYRLLPDVK